MKACPEQSRRAALDAGHGARPGRPHTGAAANGLIEDDVALDLVQRIGHHLRAAGHDTVYTRPDARLVGLSERARIARAAKCDLFLSIHLNAGPPSAHGVEAFVAKGDHASHRVAEVLVSAIAELGMASRGVKWDSQSQHSRLAVLRGTFRSMPAVLLEIGFVTNGRDSALLKSPGHRDAIATSVATCLGSGKKT
jgi:N-acetylmuramoyl-L-alanine amidase